MTLRQLGAIDGVRSGVAGNKAIRRPGQSLRSAGGMGQIAELAMKQLRAARAAPLRVANPSPSRAQELAAKIGAQVTDFDVVHGSVAFAEKKFSRGSGSTNRKEQVMTDVGMALWKIKRQINGMIGGLLFACLIGSTAVYAANTPAPRFKAVAFDYFVIFDPNSVVPEVEKVFPGKGLEFTKAWRSKQFEYGFLRSITNRHEDFFKVTGDALDYTAEQLHLTLTPANRAQLLNAYLTLKPWSDAVAALKKLKTSGVRIITISNFSDKMLRANSDHAGITDLFDVLLSTEVNHTYKPDPKAYALGMKTLRLKKNEIIFAAFGGWDAYGAKSFGYTTYWVNRFNLPAEKTGVSPDGTSANIDGLLDFVLGGHEQLSETLFQQ